MASFEDGAIEIFEVSAVFCSDSREIPAFIYCFYSGFGLIMLLVAA
jgi:hypothetical protein